MTKLQDRTVAFVGTGTTRFARFIEDQTRDELLAEAVTKAIADAGLQRSDIDGFISTISGNAYQTAAMLGLYGANVCFTNENGCGSSGYACDIARWAVQSGRCKNVVLVCGGKESATGRTLLGSNLGGRAFSQTVYPNLHWQALDPVWGGIWLHQYACQARRHMYEFGTTAEQIAAVSVGNRYNASLNPEAVYRKLITVEDVVNSKMISSPLTMLMCAAVNDGASACVMTTAERAQDLPHDPVYVLGTGSAFTGYSLTKMPDESGEFSMTRTVGKLAANRAFARAGVDRSDIDLCNWCEHFAPTVIINLEDYGFCEKGEGGAFVSDGKTKIGGALPTCTYGGEMSGTHAGGAHSALIETIRQLQHVRGVGQVKDAEVGLFASTCGKTSTHSIQILGRSR
jgi:acetyl-CoA acetyltransferase